MGRYLALLVYILRRQSLKGSGLGTGATVYQRPAMSLDFIRPQITVQVGDPTRVSNTSIRVRWTTDKNTIGLIVAGLATIGLAGFAARQRRRKAPGR